MKNILKNRFVISLITSFLMSLAFCSISYAAAITTNNATSISQTSAILNCLVDVTGSSATVWFEYGQNGSLGNSTSKSTIGINYTPQSCSSGGYNTYVISNLTPDTSYSFRAVSQDVSSTTPITYGDTLNFTTQNYNQSSSNQNSNNPNTAPAVLTQSAYNITSNSASLDGYVAPNGPNTYGWFEYATTFAAVDSGLGKKEGYQAIVTTSRYTDQIDFRYQLPDDFLKSDTQYYYRAAAQNNNGATYSQIIKTFVTSSVNTGIYTSQPIVSTNAAMLVRETSAMLNGTINSNNAAASAWFEWSENPNLSSGVISTEHLNIKDPGNPESYIASPLYNLTLGKTYYFRAVAQNIRGITYGNINQFTTQIVTPVATTPANTVSDNTPAAVSVPKTTTQTAITKNNLALEAEFDNNSPRPGKNVIYALNYKNISNSVLKNAVLTITLPNEVGYTDSSFANVDVDNNKLSFKLGDIAAKDSGSVSIKIKITELANAETLSFDSAIAYLMNGKNGKENITSELKLNSSLAASSLDTLGNIFGNAFVDLILGGLIGAWIYHFTAKKKEIVDETDPLK